MTFLAPISMPSGSRVFFRPTPRRAPVRSIRPGDEDGARQALGVDLQVPAALPAGSSLEDLARIALG